MRFNTLSYYLYLLKDINFYINIKLNNLIIKKFKKVFIFKLTLLINVFIIFSKIQIY